MWWRLWPRAEVYLMVFVVAEGGGAAAFMTVRDVS
jgi:hypothetical protein